MSNYHNQNQNNKKDTSTGPASPIPVSAEAKTIHLKIVKGLQQLTTMQFKSCRDTTFKGLFTTYLSQFEQYQNVVLNSAGYSPTCGSGCSRCCNHWVEDVNSFEAEIISEYIVNHFPESVPSIIKTCQEDCSALENIERHMEEHPQLNGTSGTELDQIDLLLSVYYQLKRPCPLLDKSGQCMIYPIRPLTCRIYMSFSSPVLCEPEYINADDIPTYLLDVDENAAELIDELHFRFVRYKDDTGLRSLLCKYLENFDNLPPYVQ
jgi:Fe-S-cluster containining protein